MPAYIFIIKKKFPKSSYHSSRDGYWSMEKDPTQPYRYSIEKATQKASGVNITVWVWVVLLYYRKAVAIKAAGGQSMLSFAT